MSITSNIATTAAGIARWGLRSVLHRSGGALPGKIGLAIDPELIAHLADLLDASVVVTGTNGKTTTTNLIADAVSASGLTCVCNRAGNNMETGIAGALLEAGSARRHTAGAVRVGVFECDELYTTRVLPRLKPTHFVLLNLFRDQLDRYGEIDRTQDAIAAALASSPETVLVFNADDPLCTAIADRVPNPRVAFGIQGATGTETSRMAESRFCAKCNAALEYEYLQYGQLGAYRCPACGWERPELAAWAHDVSLSEGGYSFSLHLPGHTAEQDRELALSTAYNGLYMVYNIMAACTAAGALGADPSRFQNVLDAYVPTGGRMTRWRAMGRTVASDLAKNPVGFDRQIQQIKASDGRLMAFFLNDAEADGRDVSWIWDVDFECLAETPGIRAFVGGSRANDLQVRLKYAEIDAQIVENVEQALASVAAEPSEDDFFAVANYTAFPPVVADLKRLSSEGVNATATPIEPTAPGERATATADTQTTALADEGHAVSAVLDRPLRIVHLYPDALNLYGDGGNAMVVERRCAWRGIPAQIDDVHMGDELDLATADIILIGGGADRDQLAVAHELRSQRDTLGAYVEDDGVMLAICGSYQLLCRSYYMGDDKIEGLGIIAADTVRGDGRLTGNVAVKTEFSNDPFVGFENHGGRTFLDEVEHPLGVSIVPGTGNNGQDGFEGCLHRNLIGTYLHGPALSKNPDLADWLIGRALERRGSAGDAQAAALLPLSPLNDDRELSARAVAMSLLP